MAFLQIQNAAQSLVFQNQLLVLLGALALLWMERLLPHEHFIKGVEGGQTSRTLRRTWLFVFAIA